MSNNTETTCQCIKTACGCATKPAERCTCGTACGCAPTCSCGQGCACQGKK